MSGQRARSRKSQNVAAEDSWWRRAQRAGIDVATVMRRAAGFMAKGGTDPEAAARSRARGESAEPGEAQAAFAERRRRADAEAAAAPLEPDRPLEIWVIVEQLGEQRWGARSIEPVGQRVVENIGKTARSAYGPDFRYRVALHLQQLHASMPWDECRSKAVRAKIYVADEIRLKS